jgi:hypothetical protein
LISDFGAQNRSVIRTDVSGTGRIG